MILFNQNLSIDIKANFDNFDLIKLWKLYVVLGKTE